MGTVQSSLAEVRLSVSPVTGGSSLRFGRVDGTQEVVEEVRVRITSTDGNQYQVFQRLLDPLTNENGVTLERDAIKTYTLLGSNAFGTLYAQNVENLTFSDQLLYTASSSGEGDTLTVVYAVQAQRLNASGRFLGRIQYTVRPIGGGSQDTTIFNVTLEAPGELKVSLEGLGQRNTVKLEADQRSDKDPVAQIKFEGNLGAQVKIFQEFENVAVNEFNEEFDSSLINFEAVAEKSGQVFRSRLDKILQRPLIYSSQLNEDIVLVQFSADEEKFAKHKAGQYRGRLKFTIDVDGRIKEEIIDFVVEVKPKFDLQVAFPPEGVRFAKVLPNSPPQFNEVEVFVNTNLGKPYMVMQSVIAAMTNEKGQEIDKKYFLIKEELNHGQAGSVVHSDFAPVEKGVGPIFISDNKGSPSQFKVIYKLMAYPEMNPGDYSTSIIYSLGEK